MNMRRSQKQRYRNMTPVKADLARALYFNRILNQSQIADLLGIRQGSVSRIVSGQVWESR
jgi:predicted transcriptional regulator